MRFQFFVSSFVWGVCVGGGGGGGDSFVQMCLYCQTHDQCFLYKCRTLLPVFWEREFWLSYAYPFLTTTKILHPVEVSHMHTLNHIILHKYFGWCKWSKRYSCRTCISLWSTKHKLYIKLVYLTCSITNL